MVIEIPDSVFEASPQYSPKELKIDVAIWLYERKKLTISRAARLAGVSLIDFNKALALRGHLVHYTESDLENDLHTMEKLFGNA